MSPVRTLVAAVWVVVMTVSATPAVASGASPATRASDATGASGATGAIDATGATDVTADLQALFDRTPDGGVVQLKAGADYRVEGTLVLEDRHNLRIEGNGARIFATTTADRTRSHLQFVGGSDLVVRNVEIEGANPHAGLDERAYVAELEAQNAIHLDGVTDMEIVGVNIHDTYGDHVYVSRHEGDRRWSQGVWIHDSVFARSGRQGIAVVAARDVVIEHNIFTDMRRATVDLEPVAASWGADNIHILDNQVGPGRLLFVAAGGRGPINWVVIARNTLRGRALTFRVEPPEGTRRQRFWVVDNTTDTPSGTRPLQFTSTDGVIVHGNRQPMNEGEALVQATDSCDVAVSGNSIGPAQPLEGESRQCNFILPVRPPRPPQVAGRGRPAPPPPTTAPTTTPTTAAATTAPPTPATTTLTSAPPSPAAQLAASETRGGDGVAGPVVVLAMVLAALAGAGSVLGINAWRARR